MDLKQFTELSGKYSLIPVYEKMTADFLTPVSAFFRLRKSNKSCFLFESVEGIGTLARFSFIGLNPKKIFSNSGGEVTVNTPSGRSILQENIFDFLKAEMNSHKAPTLDELPGFTGGIVGYLGFENISLIEGSIQFNSGSDFPAPDSIFGVYDSIVVFDHLLHRIIIIQNAGITDNCNTEEIYLAARAEIKKIKTLLSGSDDTKNPFSFIPSETEAEANDRFLQLVDMAKENIKQGDVFQLVLSKRFKASYTGDLFNLYRALRIINPSPYMYYMEFEGELVITGTSPEDLLKVQNGKAAILPIAGTRKRGKDSLEDNALAKELLNDPKEIAEHTMLVDLARNDLGRICRYGTVKLTEEMNIHYFSHVMHIVSRVEGELKTDMDCIDALKACFPAGTVTGAPKIRAVQLIDEYEKLKRGIYAGAVGYIDFRGNLDMCIAIRTLFANRNEIHWQAGAGIVADSIPSLELKEIKNKSAVMVKALEFAEVIDENSGN